MGGGQLSSFNPTGGLGNMGNMGNMNMGNMSMGNMGNISEANLSMGMGMTENFNPNRSVGNALTEYKSIPVGSLMDYSTSWS
jgi:hypothetical protein